MRFRLFILALASETAKTLARSATRDLRPPVRVVAPYEDVRVPRETLPSHRPVLVVHDLEPDPARSREWLTTALGAVPGSAVYLLLEAPLGEKFDAIRTLAGRQLLGGVGLVDEVSPEALRAALVRAHGASPLFGLARLINRRWALPPLLAYLVTWYLRLERPPATVGRFLREATLTRRELRSLLDEADLGPPAEFLRSLRVLEGALFLQCGMTVAEAARVVGYGSEDTFRRHLREVLDAAPTDLRDIRLPKMVEKAGQAS